ncbi:MAG: DUF885 domain-containing protein [Corynebacterium sp.]|nr:DUF885 domain-containing protein [Corynebacterium sp.]
MTNEMRATRNPSLLDASCEAYVRDLVAISPTLATQLGMPEYDGELQDFSPEYWETLAERNREMLNDVDAFDDGTDSCDDEDDFDSVDFLTAEILRDRLSLELELHHHDETIGLINNITSPVQEIREILQLQPKETAEQREVLAARLAKIPAALQGYAESLCMAASKNHPIPVRQVERASEHARALAQPDSLLTTLGLDKEDAVVRGARKAFGQLAEWLSDSFAAHAIQEDGVGRERYERFSHQYVGDKVDLDEAYEWGWEQLREIESEQAAIAKQLYGEGTSIARAQELLDGEARYRLADKDELRLWMQERMDAAIKDLQGTHFDIAEPARTIEACIDPAGTGGIFYTPPAEDFSRPGRAWWSVPASQSNFTTWSELSTVYHESVPGHHLQICAAMAESELLNTWRRSMCWISGHGEGWALYAEQLMAELGYFEDAGYRMGQLDAQRLRAARVIVDIGVHLHKCVPDGTVKWDANFARSFMEQHSGLTPEALDFEVDRYLGWPGQAPSYALGQKLWQQMRDDALAEGLTVREFHAKALSFGSMPMSILRSQVLDS